MNDEIVDAYKDTCLPFLQPPEVVYLGVDNTAHLYVAPLSRYIDFWESLGME